MTIFRSVLVTMKNVSKCVEKIKTHILCSIFFPRKLWPLRDTVEKCGRAEQATDYSIIRRMRFACWINKAADRHLEYIKPLLLYGNNSCTNAPQCRIINACLFSAQGYYQIKLISGKLVSNCNLVFIDIVSNYIVQGFHYMTLQKTRRKR